jgi:hypothetical protein
MKRRTRVAEKGTAKKVRGRRKKKPIARPRKHKVAEKLPYARKYFRGARWGLSDLLDKKPVGAGYLFHAVGLLATLRACQHVLINRDRKLSPEHEKVIGEWKQRTKNLDQIPELRFITRARNTLLKDGSFPSYATRSEGSWEAGVIDYETAHYLDGERRDLEIDVRAAIDWFERQLAEIEAQLPTGYEDDEPNKPNAFTDMDLTSIPPQTIAGTTPTPGIKNGAIINFARRPEPWRNGDIIEVFHHPSGRTTLTATEHERFIYSWRSDSIATGRFRLERIDDHQYRIVRAPSE